MSVTIERDAVVGGLIRAFEEEAYSLFGIAPKLIGALFAVSCVLLFMFRLLDSFKKREIFDWPTAVFDCLKVAIALGLITAYFKFCILMMNTISHAIFPIESLDEFFEAILGRRIYQSEEEGGIKLWKVISAFNFLELFTSLLAVLASMAFYLLLLWRYLYLLVLYILSPLHIIKSLLPMYGPKSLATYMSEILQVSAWSVYFAAGNLVVSETAGNTAILNLEDQVMLPVFYAAYFVYVISIPKFASSHLGGVDLSDSIFKTYTVMRDAAMLAIGTKMAFPKIMGGFGSGGTGGGGPASSAGPGLGSDSARTLN